MYAAVLLPLPLPGALHYRVPEVLESQVVVGGLVRVPLGRQGSCTGLVREIAEGLPEAIGEVKEIDAVVSATPAVRPQQLRLWEWVADYYLCGAGEVVRSALLSVARAKEQRLRAEEQRIEAGKQRKRSAPRRKVPAGDGKEAPLPQLPPPQQAAFDQILHRFDEKDVCLLHGEADAGEGDIYLHLIHRTLAAGRQVLYLLPEVAHAGEASARLGQHFGDRMGVFHSGIGANKRLALWEDLLGDGSCRLVVGVRSAVFLPFRDLGLVIVDEEHDPSYRQQEAAPRYHARNVAIVLATQQGAKVVLGSATPSVESFHNAERGKYGYVRLERHRDRDKQPAVHLVDIADLRRKKRMVSVFSPLLLERMHDTLGRDGQVVLLQHRRGFAPSLACRRCDWTPRCRWCDVSLSYHRQANLLVCHYCGRGEELPVACPDCGSGEGLRPIGQGTEQVEGEVRKLFPGVAVARLDMDTGGSRKRMAAILDGFGSGGTRILIGTQMLGRGLDFKGDGLVGILNADGWMSFPDFRAHERAYQQMSQVLGRAGLGDGRCEVVLQTGRPEHPVIRAVLEQDYEGLFRLQMEERALFHYPPLFRLVEITMRHREEKVLGAFANAYAGDLREGLGDRVLGPDRPAVGRVQGRFIRKILLKIERLASAAEWKGMVEAARGRCVAAFGPVAVQYEVV